MSLITSQEAKLVALKLIHLDMKKRIESVKLDTYIPTDDKNLIIAALENEYKDYSPRVTYQINLCK